MSPSGKPNLTPPMLQPAALNGYWQAFGAFAEAAEPLTQSTTRASLEMCCLTTARARAYLELPRTIAACRSPQDLFVAQLRFWQRAGADYIAASQRIAAALGAAAESSRTALEAGASAYRDVLAVEKEPAADQTRDGTPQRRAA